MERALELGIPITATLVMTLRAAYAFREPASSGAAIAEALLGAVGRLFRPSDPARTEALRGKLASAGFREPIALDCFIGLQTLARLVGLGGGIYLLLQGEALFAGVAFAGGLLLIEALLGGRTTTRQREIIRTFPDAIDLLVTCIDAGLGFERALERVARDLSYSSPVLGDELMVTVHEIDGGLPLEEAMKRLGARVGRDEIRAFCSVVSQASLLGSRVGQTLREYSTATRRRRMARLEEIAGKAGAKLMLPITLCLLPALMIIAMAPAILEVLRVIKGV